MQNVREKSEAYSQVCTVCRIVCVRPTEWARHIKTQKHLGNTGGTARVNANVTNKHANTAPVIGVKIPHISPRLTESLPNLEVLKQKPVLYCAKCKKFYNDPSGLWKHNQKYHKEKKNGNVIPPVVNTEVSVLTNLILELVKSNTDLQQQIQRVYQELNTTKATQMNEKGTINSNNNHSNNTINKTFNLHFFLNEQCKDAMNITDFVDSVSLQLSDLEAVGKLGYVEGISQIIIRKLNELDLYKRPIHCTDIKRDSLHIKDNNKWEREDEQSTKLRKAIKYISKKNSNLLLEWSQANPNCKMLNHQANDEYMLLIMQAMGGEGNIESKENKIIKNVAKEVYLEVAAATALSQ
jgi:hypothetical protein